MPMMKRLFFRRVLLPAIALCSLVVPVNGAHAALVTYSFTGNLNPTLDPLGLVPVSGSFQFDNTTSGSGGAYNGAVTGFTLNFGGLYSSSFKSGANAVTISQNMPLGNGIVDRWALVSAASGPNLHGYTPFSFDLRFDHKGGGLFGDTSLQDPPSLSSLTTGKWRLFFEDSEGNPAVYLGSIASLTAVPLPAAVLLFGAGLISLVGLGAGGLRNLRRTQA